MKKMYVHGPEWDSIHSCFLTRNGSRHRRWVKKVSHKIARLRLKREMVKEVRKEEEEA